MTVNAGFYRHRLQLWKSAEVRDDFGSITNERELIGTYWCKAKHDSNTENGAEVRRSLNAVTFETRYNRYLEQPDNSMYIQFRGQEWDITSVTNVAMLNEKLVITCVQRG